MKKAFLIEFDYLEDAEGIAESFGATVEELSNVALKVVELGFKDRITKRTAGLMELIESGETTGGQILAMATLFLVSVQEETLTRFLEDGVKGEI